MPFEFVDNNAAIDRAARRRIRSHVATGKNVGRTLVRPSRMKAGTREAGDRPAAAIVCIPRVVADARNAKDKEEGGCAIERMIGDGLSVLSFPEQRNDKARGIVQRAFAFVSRPYEAADLKTSIDTSELPTSMWVQFMFLDEAFFHCAIATSVTARNTLIAKKDDPKEAVRHLLEAFRLINERLSREGAISDSTIAVVVILAQHERIRGHHREGLVHLGGLERMVQLRGGIEALSRYRPGLTQKMFKVDLEFALYQGTATRFAVEDVVPHSKALFGRFNGPENNYDRALPDLVDSNILKYLSISLLTVFTDMRSLARLMNDACAGRRPKIKPYLFLDTVLLLGYRLIQVSPLSGPRTFSSLENTVHVGLAVYILAFLRGLDMRVCEVPLLSDLARSVAQNHRGSERVDKEVILWILFVGRSAALGEADDEWLLPKMAETARSLGIDSWEGACRVLATFPWVSDVHGRLGRELWDKSTLF
ncbi:hypothetical protein V495_05502 [Pseudogymnoascus sp. VKM F-4514 (FW-929)]|nr:hypothetical protein V495_05502 [Pseudogymnoascus sp. VKM F-4514 (FW-929)]KFY57731.1 hypothetical protein V497_05307 [Pseudogymnoascus sp. VKM F-4516 (FW-969)]